jgi:predicted MFS family arabinose efflux permease
MTVSRDPTDRRWLVLASAMVSFFAVGMTFFAVPPLIGTLRALFALSNLQIGLLMGSIAVPAIVLSLPLGAALDRWPPRAAGFLGLAVMLVGAVLFALASGYGWLLAGRLLFGTGALLINLLLARLLSVAFAGREVALAMGLFTGIYPVSMIVLFSLHPWLEAHLGWRGEMGVLAVLVLLAIPFHALVMPAGGEDRAAAPPSRDAPALPRSLVALGVAWALYFAAFAAVPTFAPEWAGGGAGGLLLTSVITWVALVGTPLAGGLIDRVGRAEWWCAGGLVLLTATLALMTAGVLQPVVAMAAVGVVAALVPPAVYSLPARLVPGERVGLAFGFITALSNLGTVIGPALAGVIRDTTPSWPAVWGTLAVVALASAGVAVLIRPPRSA